MQPESLIGLGLRHPHYMEVLNEHPKVAWFEVHSENFFQAGGSAPDFLTKIAQIYPISLHGVGLSLGSVDDLDLIHLKRLKNLISQVNPFLVSEHLSWGKIGKQYLPDLLPIAYTDESLKIFCKNVSFVQDFLNCQLLIENPSSYLQYHESHWHEAEFLAEVCRRTGCQLLLDVNNIFVSSCNHGWDAQSYLNKIPTNVVKEIHLAGHSLKELSNHQILRIDTHDQKVCFEVWQLYASAIKRFGRQLTLLEWDSHIPSLGELMQEASIALSYLKELDYA